MKKTKLTTFLFGGIAVCITIILILFSGTLSDDKNKIESVSVTDSLFVPDSVVKLTEVNQKLIDEATVREEKIVELETEFTQADEKVKLYEKLSEAAYYLSVNDVAKATDVLSVLDISTMDENARILYENISKQINKGE